MNDDCVLLLNFENGIEDNQVKDLSYYGHHAKVKSTKLKIKSF